MEQLKVGGRMVIPIGEDKQTMFRFTRFEKNRFKREKFTATRTAKLRLSNLKLEELTQVMRGKAKQIKH